MVAILRQRDFWIPLLVGSAAVACGSSLARAISVDRRCTILIDFHEGSSALTSAALDELNRFVMECADLYDRTIVVHGYTDSREAPAGGLPLSRARAESVRSYLKSTGVLARSIEAEGLGNQPPAIRPVGDPWIDDYVRAQNRRAFGYVERTPKVK